MDEMRRDAPLTGGPVDRIVRLVATTKGYGVKIKCEDAVMALKRRGISTTAKCLADYLGGTDSRAVATALRNATKDGRVAIKYRNGIGWYRFKRLTPNFGVTGS